MTDCRPALRLLPTLQLLLLHADSVARLLASAAGLTIEGVHVGVSPLGGVVSPLDGVVSPLGGVVSPLGVVVSPLGGVVSRDLGLVVSS